MPASEADFLEAQEELSDWLEQGVKDVRAIGIDLGIDARFINIEDPELVGLEMKLVRDTKQYEVPWVFLRGEFIGGYNALDEIQRLGKLEERTLPPGERPAQRKSRIRIEAPAAPSEPSSSPPGGARSTGD